MGRHSLRSIPDGLLMFTVGGLLSSPVIVRPSAADASPPVIIPVILFHRDGNRLLAEIPRRTLNTDLLITCQIDTESTVASASQMNPCLTTSADMDTIGTRVEARTYWHLTQRGTTLGTGQRDSTRLPILRIGPDSAPVIDATSMFPRGTGHALTIRAMISQPHGIDVELAQRSDRETVIVHWRLLQLPNRPVSIGRDSVAREVIPLMHAGLRRLEKRDPWAVVSDVVHPIVYTLDPATPPQWVRFITRGVEEWNPAFAAIGFRHAIQVRTLRGANRNVVWATLNDGHHDVIVWHINSLDADARKFVGGETFPESDARNPAVLAHAAITIPSFLVDRVASDRLMSTAAAFDPVMQRQPVGWDTQCPLRCPIPDSLAGLVLQGVTAHELGHALGLDHNFAGRLAYPTDSLRSRRFVDRMGYTPTVMDYTWTNSVAQPEDHFPVSALTMHVGLYDRWAIAWVYRPILGAYTPAAERPTLAQWRTAQDTAPYLRATTDRAVSEDLIGDDPLKATAYHVRLVALLLTRFSSSDGMWPNRIWGNLLPEAGAVGDYAGSDSAHIVALVQFYLAHLVLGQDPILQTAGVTWSTVPTGWNLEMWRTQWSALLDSFLRSIEVLVASDQTSRSTRVGVCQAFQHATDTLGILRAEIRDTVVRAHQDSVRVRLTAIHARATCTP